MNKMDISIQHLKLVNVVVKEGSITKAADKLCLSQPALSHQLKSLEEKIEMKVFNRVHKKMVLTEAGNLLFQTSEKMLTSLNQLSGKLNSIKNGGQRIIRLSTECYTTYHWLPNVVDEFHKEHENVSIQIVIEATKSPLQYLLDGHIDVAIVSRTNDDSSIHYEKLIEDEMVVIASINNPISRLNTIDLKDLKKENLITYDIDEKNNFVINHILSKNLELVNSIQKVQLTEAIIQLVKANLGIAVMARWALNPFIESKELKIIPFKSTKGIRTWYTASLNETSEVESEFIEKVKQIFSSPI